MLRTIVAVIVAGIVGTIANSVIVAGLTENTFTPLALSVGRNLVAIIVAILIPILFASMARVPAALVSVAALTVIPSILAKTVFGLGAPWPFVLGVNAVYAAAALLVYLAIMGRRQSQPFKTT